MIVFIVFVVWKLTDVLVAYVVSTLHLNPYASLFGYLPYTKNIPYPDFIVALANFDGAHYLHIAHDGYQAFEQAFFPFYPLLIRFFAFYFMKNVGYLLIALLIANVCFFVAVYVLSWYLRQLQLSKNVIIWTILFLLAFPMSFFTGAAYTEGLFFFLMVTALWSAEKKYYLIAAVASYLAATTRLMGVFLWIPLGATLYSVRRLKFPHVALLGAPVAGLVSYMVYLAKTTHDPLRFYAVLPGFNTGRSGRIAMLPHLYWRYFKIFLTAEHNFIWVRSIIEFFLFNIILLVLFYDLGYIAKHRDIPHRISLLGLNIFSLANLIVPASTGTLISVPRYAIVSLSFFLALARLQRNWRYPIFAVSAILHILFLALFIQGYFIA